MIQRDELVDRVTGKASKVKTTALTPIVNLIRELGLGAEILGRDYEVRDCNGVLLYNVRQKPIDLRQLNILLEELNTLNELEKEQMDKSSKVNKGRRR